MAFAINILPKRGFVLDTVHAVRVISPPLGVAYHVITNGQNAKTYKLSFGTVAIAQPRLPLFQSLTKGGKDFTTAIVDIAIPFALKDL